MKRITVKDKILLHIQQYKGYQQEYELPKELTQAGIAAGVGISRSHAAITLAKLRDKEYVNDQLARVQGMHRQRKVYFITPRGEIYTAGVRDIFYTKTVMTRDMEGNETEITVPDLTAYLYPFINRYISIYEVINQLGKDNIFDSKSFIEKSNAEEAVKSKKVMEEKVTEKSAQTQSTTPAWATTQASLLTPMAQSLSPITAHDPKKSHMQNYYYPPQDGTPQYAQYNPQQPGQYPAPNFYPNFYYSYYYWYHYRGQNKDWYAEQFYRYKPNYNYPQYPYYPYGFRLVTHEERKKQILGEMKTFFSLGAFFCVLGILSLLLSGGFCFPGYFVITMLGLIFALIGFSVGFRRIVFTGTKGRRLILAMGIFFVANFLLMLESMLFNFIVYLDITRVGPVILAMLGFLGLITLVKPINTKYRTELAFSVGIFCLLFGVFSGLLLPEYYLTNPFVFAPFWILFGITCMVVGNELIGKIQPKEKFTKIINYSIVGTGAFLFLTLLIRLIASEYESELLHLSYISDLCWLGVGAYLISFRVVKKDYTTKMLAAIKISLPIGLGLLFILFGIFLGLMNKFIEGLVEIIIGAVVIRYGLTKNIFSKSKSEMLIKLSFPIFIIVSESVTFYLILYG